MWGGLIESHEPLDSRELQRAEGRRRGQRD